MKPRYEAQPPHYCDRRNGWVVEYKVINGKDVHGATEGFVKKKSFEEARIFYLEITAPLEDKHDSK